MRTFIRIVESGSLSAAARQLDTTQATVSRRLQSLETLLGVRLLLRTTHAMKLTDDGERCYHHARRVIDSWLALEDEVGGPKMSRWGFYAYARRMRLVRNSYCHR